MYRIAFCVLALLLLAWVGVFDRSTDVRWNQQELARIKTLMLPNKDQQQQMIITTGNKYAHNTSAAELGKQLFFDKRLSLNNKISCANCHQPEFGFSDPAPLSTGIGITKRHSPSLLGVAASPWHFWDGRADSLWAQALGPLEDPAEQGTNRLQLAHLMDTYYSTAYQSIFGQLPGIKHLVQNASPSLNPNYPQWHSNWQALSSRDQKNVDQIFANIGKSLAAYQNLLMPSTSRFDLFTKELLDTGESDILTQTEKKGLKLFINDDKAQCMRCHNGPLFTNNDFQVTGIKDTFTPLGKGRAQGINTALKSRFNCNGIYADIIENKQCSELNFAKKEGSELNFAFKVPSLRNISKTAPYMHNGSLVTLQDVLHFYTRAKSQYPITKSTNKLANTLKQPSDKSKKDKNTLHLDIEPLPLASNQLKQIEAFLLTLDSIEPLADNIISPLP